MVSLESKNPEDVIQLILKELETRPTDVNIRIRLLKHLLQQNHIKEAYRHIQEIEHKSVSIFLNNLEWYETVAEILLRYQRDTTLIKNLTWEFWMLLICVLDKVASLTLGKKSFAIKNNTDYINAVFKFDQTLKVAIEKVSDCPEKHLSQEFINHYRGQLCFHLVTLLFKQADKEFIQFKEVSNLALPLLFAAYHTQPATLQSIWLEQTKDNYKKLVQRWHREAAFRCSQVGHILLVISKDKRSAMLEKATQCTFGMWREQVFKR